MMRPDAINSHLRQMRPVIMDHTVREPATTTPFGHTGYMKWLTLKIIQKMNIKDIAISGQYYGSSYTPETQILEWLHYKGESMDGMVVMFAPGEREAGIKAIRDYQIPNAFLDLTLKAGRIWRFSQFMSPSVEGPTREHRPQNVLIGGESHAEKLREQLEFSCHCSD